MHLIDNTEIMPIASSVMSSIVIVRPALFSIKTREHEHDTDGGVAIIFNHPEYQLVDPGLDKDSFYSHLMLSLVSSLPTANIDRTTCPLMRGYFCYFVAKEGYFVISIW